jgi:hypothetical protein
MYTTEIEPGMYEPFFDFVIKSRNTIVVYRLSRAGRLPPPSNGECDELMHDA